MELKETERVKCMNTKCDNEVEAQHDKVLILCPDCQEKLGLKHKARARK